MTSDRLFFFIALGAALLALSAGVFLFVVIRTERTAVEYARAEAQDLSLRKAAAEGGSVRSDERAAAQAALAGHFLSQTGVVEMIETIEGFEELTGVALDVVSVEWEARESDTMESEQDVLAVRFTASGLWSGVMHALRLTESLSVVVIVERAGFEQDAKGGGNLWRGTFDIVFPTAP